MKMRKFLNGVLACTMALSMVSMVSAAEITLENSNTISSKPVLFERVSSTVEVMNLVETFSEEDIQEIVDDIEVAWVIDEKTVLVNYTLQVEENPTTFFDSCVGNDKTYSITVTTDGSTQAATQETAQGSDSVGLIFSKVRADATLSVDWKYNGILKEITSAKTREMDEL
ncbi:MAG: hypothetical protein R3Y63_13505 [Eubacteriales bacterium]